MIYPLPICKIHYNHLKRVRFIENLNDKIEILYCKHCKREFTEYQVYWQNYPDNYYIIE